ncbi:hypothetical protein Ancab_011622 [Ancistrocladus abbreviatus]
MVRAKGKGKAKAFKSKARSFDSLDYPESLIAQSGQTETNIEESLAPAGEEEGKENSDEEVEMEEELDDAEIDDEELGDEVDDEEIDEEDMAEMIVEGTTADAECEEKETHAKEGMNKEKEVPNETNSDGPIGVTRIEDDEDDNVNEDIDYFHHLMKEVDNRDATAVCKSNAEESMLASESEVREENREVDLTNETGRVANKMDSNLQGDDISGGKNLKKPNEKIIKNEVVRGEEAINEVKPQPASESEVREENIEVDLTNETGGVSNKTDTNVQGNDISRGKKLKKPNKKSIKSKVVKRKEATNEVKLQPAHVNTNELVKQDEKVEIKPVDKVKNLRKVGKKKKKVVQRHTMTGVTIDDKQESLDKDKAIGKKEIEEENVKGVERKGKNYDSVVEKSRKRGRLMATEVDVKKGTEKDKYKAETSRKDKSKKKVASMGMIFMCSSKTKKDCYHYKVMGLPATKKDMVFKVYKGMTLFLYDFDLRLLYGIYKAAGPGGYNIEPRAFNSEFPSQVRFSILEDCLPLGEEKFRKVIKDNYYTRSKFNCELSAEQVKNLCKLFQEAGKDKSKGSKPKNMNVGERMGASSSSRKRDRKRRRVQDDVRRDRMGLDGEYDRWARQEVWRDHVVVDDGRMKQGRDELRRDPVVMDDGYDRRPLVYEREAFVPALAAPAALAPPIPQVPARGLSYVYGRTSAPEVYQREMAYGLHDRGLSSVYDVYRRDLSFEHHDRGLPSSGVRFQGEPEPHEPYASYRQSLAYRDPLFPPAGAPAREYYDYSRAGSSAEYRPPAVRSAAYTASETSYRRY